MDKGKAFGLTIPKRSKTFQPKRSSGIFGSDSEDDAPSAKKTKSAKIPQSKPISSMKNEEIDPSIYEYDEIYDDIKAQKAAEIAPAKGKKSSRYIDHLLKAADKRKKEYERRVERKVQIEREKEGDEFDDKEMFVTSAYKKKLKEREEEEERERRENQINDMMDVTKQKDLSGFYRHFLKQSTGEEKVPEFGANKFTIKKEPQSDSEDEHIPKPTKDTTRKVDLDKHYSDSEDEHILKPPKDTMRKLDLDKDYSDSEDENIPKPTKDTTRKLDLDKDYSDSEENSDGNSLNKTKKLDTLIDKDFTDSENDSEQNTLSEDKDKSQNNIDEKELEEVVKSTPGVEQNSKKIHKYKKTYKNKNESEESDSSSDTEKADDSQINDNVVKRNIFAKRTIDEVFATAQARYFQRLAARSAI